MKALLRCLYLESFNGPLKPICRLTTDFLTETRILIRVLRRIYVEIIKLHLLDYHISSWPHAWLKYLLRQSDDPGSNHALALIAILRYALASFYSRVDSQEPLTFRLNYNNCSTYTSGISFGKLNTHVLYLKKKYYTSCAYTYHKSTFILKTLMKL